MKISRHLKPITEMKTIEDRLESARHYLMSTPAEALRVEDALIALGYDRNGMEIFEPASQFRPFSSSGEAEPTIVSDEEIINRAKYLYHEHTSDTPEIDRQLFNDGAIWMRSEMLRRSSGAAVRAEEIEKEAREESLKMKPEDPFLQGVFEMGYKAGASRLSSVAAESPAGDGKGKTTN